MVVNPFTIANNKNTDNRKYAPNDQLDVSKVARSACLGQQGDHAKHHPDGVQAREQRRAAPLHTVVELLDLRKTAIALPEVWRGLPGGAGFKYCSCLTEEPHGGGILSLVGSIMEHNTYFSYYNPTFSVPPLPHV